jgi:hypothetical protein
VIVCEPQREQKLAAALAEAGHGAIAPTYTAWGIRRHVGTFRKWEGGRWFSRERTLIPFYVFSTISAEELHAFRRDGAIRVISGRQSDTMRFLAEIFTDWAAGAYNDPTPLGLTPKPAPISNRNRKTRRAAQARRQVLDWHAGLIEAKAFLTYQQEKLDQAA